ncbi:MAG: type II secretion system protein [Patescibacteria group bacterium]
MRTNLSKQNGFTLVEIMVATSIFMVIMIVALGALITSSDTAKKAQALRTAMDNVSFAMESMTRSLRMGTNYTCGNTVSLDGSSPTDCPSGAGAVAFVPYSGLGVLPRTVAYKLNQRADNTFALQRCNPTCLDMVSSDVNVDYLKFFLNGSSSTLDTIQPSISILIRGTVTIKGQGTVFAIQTSVSQRSAEY